MLSFMYSGTADEKAGRLGRLAYHCFLHAEFTSVGYLGRSTTCTRTIVVHWDSRILPRPWQPAQHLSTLNSLGVDPNNVAVFLNIQVKNCSSTCPNVVIVKLLDMPPNSMDKKWDAKSALEAAAQYLAESQLEPTLVPSSSPQHSRAWTVLAQTDLEAERNHQWT